MNEIEYVKCIANDISERIKADKKKKSSNKAKHKGGSEKSTSKHLSKR